MRRDGFLAWVFPYGLYGAWAGFIGIGWDWDILLVEMMMQATNFGIAACLHFRRQLLRHSRSYHAVLLLVVSNTALRIAVFSMFIEISRFSLSNKVEDASLPL